MNLEFARPFAGPSFDDDFLVGEEFDSVTALRMHHTEEAALPSGKGKVGHGRRYADVDADVAGRYGVAEFACGRARGREDRTGVAVCGPIDHVDSFFDGVGVDHRKNGAEYFGFHQGAGGWQAVEDSRANERTGVAIGACSPIDDGLGALVSSLADQREYAFPTCVRDDGPHLRCWIEAVADLERGSRGGDGFAEPILGFADSDCDADG
jgi:hypothetical protein